VTYLKQGVEKDNSSYQPPYYGMQLLIRILLYSLSMSYLKVFAAEICEIMQ